MQKTKLKFLFTFEAESSTVFSHLIVYVEKFNALQILYKFEYNMLSVCIKLCLQKTDIQSYTGVIFILFKVHAQAYGSYLYKFHCMYNIIMCVNM